MMLDLTRRGFLGRLVAVPAIALIPNSIVAAAEHVNSLLNPITPGSPLIITDGLIEDIIFWYEGVPKDAHASIGIMRPDGSQIVQCGITTRSTFRWRALPGGPIMATEDHPAMIYAQRIPGLRARVSAQVKDLHFDNRYFYGDEGARCLVELMKKD